MCRNETLFFQDGYFAWGIKRICLAAQSKIFRHFYCTFSHRNSFLAQNTSEHNPFPQNPLFFLHPTLPLQFLVFPSPFSPSHSLPWLRLPSQVLEFDFQLLFSQFISNWHFIEFNLQGGTMGTFHHTEWYEKPQTSWMGSERQNKINKWVSQSDPEYWWQQPQCWATLHFSSNTYSSFNESLFSLFVFFIVSQGTCSLLTQMC